MDTIDMITIVETAAFSKQTCLTPEELEALIMALADDPKAGTVIPRTGGLRKLRFAIGNKGKSGGSRVIYYYHNESHPLFLLYAYAKSKQENLTPEQERLFASIAQAIKEGLKHG